MVFTAASVADVVVDSLIRDGSVGATESTVHTALRRQDVEGAVVARGDGAALVRQTLAGGLGAGFAFLLQRTVVAQQAAQRERREDRSCDQQDGGQEAACTIQMDVQINVKFTQRVK